VKGAQALSVLLTFFVVFSAHAETRLEVGLGISRPTLHEDGIWWQSPFPHHIESNPLAFLLGLTGDLGPRTTWHVDAVSLGGIKSDAQAVPNDANFNPSSPTGCNGACLPLARYVGSGKVYGVAATLELHITGEWQFGVEGGPFVYHSSWNISVPNWYLAVQTVSGTFVTFPVSPVDAHQNQWAFGGVAGASLRYQNLTLSLREYLDGKDSTGAGPPLWKRHTVLMLKYTF